MPTRTFFRRLNDVIEPAVRRGAGNVPVGPGVFVLETTGRVTGRARRVPLLGHRTCTSVTATTVRPTSQWVRNLEASPDATIWLDGHARPVTADVRTVAGLRLATLNFAD